MKQTILSYLETAQEWIIHYASWTWDFSVANPELVSAMVGGLTLAFLIRQNTEQRKEQNKNHLAAVKSKNDEIFEGQSEIFANRLNSIVAKTGNDHDSVLDKDFSEIKDELLRTEIHHVIDRLARVYLINCQRTDEEQNPYYKEFWKNKMNYVFSHRLFLTAFDKFYKADKSGFTDSYIEKVNKCRSKFRKKNLVKRPTRKIEIKKGQSLAQKTQKPIKVATRNKSI